MAPLMLKHVYIVRRGKKVLNRVNPIHQADARNLEKTGAD